MCSSDLVASSPLEQEKMDLEKAIEFSKTAIQKYAEKKTKLGDLKNKLEEVRQKVAKEQVYVELVDKTGERKFIRTKLEQEAKAEQHAADHPWQCEWCDRRFRTERQLRRLSRLPGSSGGTWRYWSHSSAVDKSGRIFREPVQRARASEAGPSHRLRCGARYRRKFAERS